MGLDGTVAGVRHVAHDVLPSTNAEALRLARLGEDSPLWITAGRQTAGRGRRGRVWVSQPGNVHATLLLNAPAPAARWPELSFVAALAIVDAVTGAAADGGNAVAIKWPNDVLLDGKKFAGVLVEGECGSSLAAVAVGIGINCVSHPKLAAYPATDLVAAGVRVSRADLFAGLSTAMLQRLEQWNRGAGFPAIRADWLARAAGREQQVRVRVGERELIGFFETVDPAGRLVLRLPDGAREHIS